MRFRFFTFLFLCSALFIWLSEASAQKRVFWTISPNDGIFNRNADLYDPLTGAITRAAGQMNTARENHAAVVLRDGRVLIAGGYNDRFLKSAEIFNPVDGSFAATGELSVPRSGATAIALRGGTVLIAGGYNGVYLRSAETFDASQGKFRSVIDAMSVPRQNAKAVLLNDGSILIAGGYNGEFLTSAELYDPSLRNFNPAQGTMTEARYGHTATLLADGKVLLTGGCNNTQVNEIVCDRFLASAEVFDPATSTFTATGSMSAPRYNHTATMLPDGRILIAGGSDGVSPLASAEIYNPATGTFSRVGAMGAARSNHTASSLPNGDILIAGGHSDQYLASVEVFNPLTATFTTRLSNLSVPRALHAATVLNDGKVLLTGGRNGEPLLFDTNFQSYTDNIAPNIFIAPDSGIGFVPYTGSGVILAFSTETGAEVARIETGGFPAHLSPFQNGNLLAAFSALDNRIFIIDTNTMSLHATYVFPGATFGFGSIPVFSPDESFGYISSTATGEVIKFNASTGAVTAKLGNLSAPARITITRDGNSLLVVDTLNNEVAIVNAQTMAKRHAVTLLSRHPNASLTIFNEVVLNADDTLAAIASQDISRENQPNALFVFDPRTGQLIIAEDGADSIFAIGYRPGYSTYLPSIDSWLFLSQNSLSVIPASKPSEGVNYSTGAGGRLSSANIAISADGRYAFYTSAQDDRLFQQDLSTGAVVGSYRVGDNPNISMDQASSVAVTPDGRVIVVLNYAGNSLDLLTDSAIMRQTKFLSQADRFTGLSLVNLSESATEVTITAFEDAGFQLAGTNIINPAVVTMAPNAQSTIDIAELFNLGTTSYSGHLHIESPHPVVVGHSAIGQIRSGFMEAFVINLEGIPLFADFRRPLRDWIIPEIPGADGTVELNFVNPNFNGTTLDLDRYDADGTVIDRSVGVTLNALSRTVQDVSGVATAARTGQVLIVGGYSAQRTRADAELYAPAGRTFSREINFPRTPRYGHASALLVDSDVFISGGRNRNAIHRSAELYDRRTNLFTYTAGSMSVERYRHTATVLQNGKVLLAGGQNSASINNTAELYDPATGRFAPIAGRMNSPRDAHTATLLGDGKVLLAGGMDGVAVASSTELYDPVASTFTPAGRMNVPRAFHTAVRLADGKVLMLGGYNGAYLNSVELYDPDKGVFSLLPQMSVARSHHTANLLSDGTVLIAGGRNASGPLSHAEVFDPSTGVYYQTVNHMSSARSSHTATLVPGTMALDGTDQVFIVGGAGYEVGGESADVRALATAEIFDLATMRFTGAGGNMVSSRQEHSAILLKGVTDDSSGYFRGTSSAGVLFNQEYSNGGATTSINGIDMDKFIGVKRIFSPRFVISPEQITLLNVINGNMNSNALVTLTLRASDGAVLATQDRLLPTRAQLRGNLWEIFNNDPALENRYGWLEIASSEDHIVGTVSFTDPENKFLATIELSGTPMERFVYPLVSEDQSFSTQITLLNSGNDSAGVRIELWGLDGKLLQSRNVSINKNTHMSAYLSELFPSMRAVRSANVRVFSDRPLHALGLLSAVNLRFMSSVAPVEFPESAIQEQE
ncbi:MAG TPA: kelch repeat-containing protein [Acidobacteriota bacterium]|nr:kelch repeat-containing protein [Acidobacteriota bacterium]